MPWAAEPPINPEDNVAFMKYRKTHNQLRQQIQTRQQTGKAATYSNYGFVDTGIWYLPSLQGKEKPYNAWTLNTSVDGKKIINKKLKILLRYCCKTWLLKGQFISKHLHTLNW